MSSNPKSSPEKNPSSKKRVKKVSLVLSDELQTCYICFIITLTIFAMNQFLNDHTSQADALSSIAESLSAISVCSQWVVVILAGILTVKFISFITSDK